MQRITWMQLGKKKYPLNFSVDALTTISEKFGGMDAFSDIFDTENKDRIDMLKDVCWLLNVLITEGCAYVKLDEDIDIAPLSEKNLRTLIDAREIDTITPVLLGAMLKGNENTVEVEEDPKNVQAMPEN